MTEDAFSHAFARLDPDTLLNAVERFGMPCDGRIITLNSYENRVFQLGLVAGGYVIAKFYRPERWSRAAILEEHQFTLELAQAEIPVPAPLRNEHGDTLLEFSGFDYAVFPRIPGRSPELNSLTTLRSLGRCIARLHSVGELSKFRHRPNVSVAELGRASMELILNNATLPHELCNAYRNIAEPLLTQIDNAWAIASPLRQIRLHGDCHIGNILWNDDGPNLIDFDDCRNGPALQDLWMLLSGDRVQMTQQLVALLGGYREFRNPPLHELQLIEPLRTLRMFQYSAWLAQRWHDPAFPMHFPWFGTQHYWQDQIRSLQEQSERLNETPWDALWLDFE